MNRNGYKPPRRSGLSPFTVIGGLLAALLVFLAIPLSQKLGDIFQPKTTFLDEDQATVDPPPDFELEEPPPPPEEEEPPPPELSQESSDLDLALDLPNLSLGTGGGIVLEIAPKFGVQEGGEDVFGSDLDSPPKATSRFPPQYPSKLLKKRITGTVFVLALIDENGLVTSTAVEKSSGQKAMDTAALKAVRRWKFNAGVRQGRPVKSKAVVPINFKISS